MECGLDISTAQYKKTLFCFTTRTIIRFWWYDNYKMVNNYFEGVVPVIPNVSWAQFAVCNPDATSQFEQMCRQLFIAEYTGGELTQTNHNTPGVEVIPMKEAPHNDGSLRKMISFQAKYFEQGNVDYTQICHSASETVKHFRGQLDQVYLFCNKTLTTTSKGYKKAEKILADAGIKLIPISNVDLLALIQRHLDIARYYFTARYIADGYQRVSINEIPCASHGMVTTAASYNHTSGLEKSVSSGLVEKLVEERIQKYRIQIVRLELGSIKADLNKLFSYDRHVIDSLPEAGELYYYQFLIELFDGKKISSLSKCGSEYKEEAKWLLDFYRDPQSLSPEEYRKHTAVTQVFALDKLLTGMNWNELVDLYESVRDDSDETTHYQLDLHYGLALLNLRRYSEASSVLHKLYDKTNEDRMLLYAVLADLSIENNQIENGKRGNEKRIYFLLDQLHSLRNSKAYKDQEAFAAGLMLESAYFLGLTDKAILVKAIKEYGSFSEETQSNEIVLLFYALCLELDGKFNETISVYQKLPWRSNPAYGQRYLIALILDNKFEEVLEAYKKIEAKSIEERGMYLLALQKTGSESFLKELGVSVEKYKGNVEKLFEVISFMETEDEAVRNIILPPFHSLITIQNLKPLKFYRRIQIISFLAQCGDILFLEPAIASVEHLSELSANVIHEIYKSLFKAVNEENGNQSNHHAASDRLRAVERIADRFLSEFRDQNTRKLFLQIKMPCAVAQKLTSSFLVYGKELFAIFPEVQLARNIVTVLVGQRVTRFDEYQPYLSMLESSEVPEHSVIAACALQMSGHKDEAEYYAYKALYLLNGKDDFQVYQEWLSFSGAQIEGLVGESDVQFSKDSTVVTLEDEEKHRIELCLDSESEFNDPDNKSLGIRHVPAANHNFIKLHRAGVGQKINLLNKQYSVVKIVPRIRFAFGFVFQKVTKSPDKFNGMVKVITSTSAEDMVAKLQAFVDVSDQMNGLLASYHLESNDLGLPIDCLTLQNYGRYIDAMKYLLFREDEIFLAGYPVREDETGQQYIPDLSTLVLLAIMNRLNLLSALKESIIIPESYFDFLNKQYSESLKHQSFASSQSYIDNKPLILPEIKSSCEIWEEILNFCDDCSKAKVSDEERSHLTVKEGLSGEMLTAILRISYIHLDAMIIAQREHATFLCDDLFFRKVASAMRLRNLNTVSLLLHVTDSNFVVPFDRELSKTNYFYLPIIVKNDEDAPKILHNLLTGKLKKKFYLDALFRINEVYRQLKLEMKNGQAAE